MSNLLTNDTDLRNIAQAIRVKTGGSDSLVFPNGFVNAINGIEIRKAEETFNITPTTSQQTVTPTSGKVFSSGIVEAIPEVREDNLQGGITVTIA